MVKVPEIISRNSYISVVQDLKVRYVKNRNGSFESFFMEKSLVTLWVKNNPKALIGGQTTMQDLSFLHNVPPLFTELHKILKTNILHFCLALLSYVERFFVIHWSLSASLKHSIHHLESHLEYGDVIV